MGVEIDAGEETEFEDITEAQLRFGRVLSEVDQLTDGFATPDRRRAVRKVYSGELIAFDSASEVADALQDLELGLRPLVSNLVSRVVQVRDNPSQLPRKSRLRSIVLTLQGNPAFKNKPELTITRALSREISLDDLRRTDENGRIRRQPREMVGDTPNLGKRSQGGRSRR